jgi:RNA polymerase sigma-70 factor (ECF subfamily)
VDDSDEVLMERAGTGDRAACQILVERHLGRIVTFTQRLLGNRADAEDAAQDVFLRVWSAAPRWERSSAHFRTWLHRVAMNVCLDRIARKRETAAGDLPDLADPRPGPSGALQASEVTAHVSSAIAALPETQRVALTLCHWQGLHNSEAADVMGVSVEALESLLARARRSLRAHLRAIAPALLRGA